jgi:3-oxoadipate enol-lactonase
MAHKEVAFGLTRVADLLLTFRPLINALQTRPRVTFMGNAFLDTLNIEAMGNAAAIFKVLCDQLGIAQIRTESTDAPPKLTIFEQSLNHQLKLQDWSWLDDVQDIDLSMAALDASESALQNGFEILYGACKSNRPTADSVKVYCAGPASATPILLIAPCGLPVEICRHWFGSLSQGNFIVGWETRRMFPASSIQDKSGWEVGSQVEDACEALSQMNIESAHVIGLCGGATIAVLMSKMHPNRVRTLSLWHGDYWLGKESPLTQHQENLKSLLDFASRDGASAAVMQSSFSKVPLSKGFEHLSQFLLYPYANADLLYSYARLNGALMNEDVSHLLPAIHQPTLIVTSSDDTTAHPGASQIVAASIPNSQLITRTSGSHLDLFVPNEDFQKLALDFIRDVE